MPNTKVKLQHNTTHSNTIATEDEPTVITPLETPLLDDSTPSDNNLNTIIDENNNVNVEAPINELDPETPPISENDDEVINIDNIDYVINDKGDALLNGEVVYTKEQIEAMGSSEVQTTKEISKLSGIVILDEKGEELETPLTIEDLANRESQIKKLGEQEGWSKGFNEFLNANPDIANVVRYKNQYGTIEGFTSYIDYSAIKLDKTNSSQLEDVIYKAEIKRGRTPEKAKNYIEYCKANNDLESTAQESLDYLTNSQKTEVQAIQQQQQLEYQKALEEETKYIGVKQEGNQRIPIDSPGSIYDVVVNKGEIKGFKIPKEGVRVKTDKGVKQISRIDLFNYLTVPSIEFNGDFISQAQYDIYQKTSSPSDYALHCILNLLGGSEQLVKVAIENEKVKQVRKLNSKASTTIGSSATNPKDNSVTKQALNLPIKR